MQRQPSTPVPTRTPPVQNPCSTLGEVHRVTHKVQGSKNCLSLCGSPCPLQHPRSDSTGHAARDHSCRPSTPVSTPKVVHFEDPSQSPCCPRSPSLPQTPQNGSWGSQDGRDHMVSPPTCASSSHNPSLPLPNPFLSQTPPQTPPPPLPFDSIPSLALPFDTPVLQTTCPTYSSSCGSAPLPPTSGSCAPPSGSHGLETRCDKPGTQEPGTGFTPSHCSSFIW